MSANAMALNTGEVPEFTSTNLILTTTQQLRARNTGHAERIFSQVYCEDVNLVLHRQRMPGQQRHESTTLPWSVRVPSGRPAPAPYPQRRKAL